MNKNNILVKNNSLQDKTLKTDICDCMIVNLWPVVNYGASLTCFGVKCLVENLGYKAKIVNYIPTAFKQKFENSFAKDFSNKYLDLTSPCYSYSDLLNLNKYCKTFVVGSDQVWSYPISRKFAENITYSYFYLNFANYKARKISYAASIGHDNFDSIPYSDLQNIEFFLNQFDAISVREDTAVSMLEKTFGIKATQLIDGAFHIPRNILDELTKPYETTQEDYILVFCLPYFNNIEECSKNITKLSQKVNLPVKIVLFDKTQSLGQWLYFIKKAKFVITDSFHAIVFSIIYNVPFIQLINAVKTQSRFESLFRLLEISNYSSKSLENIDFNEIVASFNWAQINTKLEKEIKRSQDWMKHALSIPKELKGNIVNDIIATQLVEKYTNNYIIEDLKCSLQQHQEKLSLFINRNVFLLKYYKCKLLSKITFGKMRKHYKKKRKELKAKIKQVKQFLKGK